MEWKDEDEVTTTFRSIQVAKQQAFMDGAMVERARIWDLFEQLLSVESPEFQSAVFGDGGLPPTFDWGFQNAKVEERDRLVDKVNALDPDGEKSDGWIPGAVAVMLEETNG